MSTQRWATLISRWGLVRLKRLGLSIPVPSLAFIRLQTEKCSLFLLLLRRRRIASTSPLLLLSWSSRSSGLAPARRTCILFCRVRPNHRPEVVESASLVVLPDFLNAGRWQNWLSQALSSYFLVKVSQIALILDWRHERCRNLFLKQFLHVQICKERMHQNFVHVVVLTKALSTVLVQHLKNTKEIIEA